MLVRSRQKNQASCTLPRRIKDALDPSGRLSGERHLQAVESPPPPYDVSDHWTTDITQPETAYQPTFPSMGDDKETATLLQDALSDRGCAVVLALEVGIGLAKSLVNQPDIVLCSLRMPRICGLVLMQRLAEADPGVAGLPFVFLTSRNDRDSVLAARRAWGDDFPGKPVASEMLEVPVESRSKRATHQRIYKTKTHLTEREKEVLTWVGRGKTSADIAIILRISERTVNFHCDNAMKRLDVVNRTQAVVTAIAQGLMCI